MIQRYFPAAVLAFTVLYLGSAIYNPSEPADQAQIKAFGRLPVVYQGRQKPIDTLARNMLKVISDKQSWRDENKKSHTATEWLLDVIARPDVAKTRRVFRIEHDQILDTLGLEARTGSFRYSWEEVTKNWDTMVKMIRSAHGKDASQRDLVDTKAMELSKQISVYQQLAGGQIPMVVPSGSEEVDWIPLAEAFQQPLAGQAKEDAKAWRDMLKAWTEQDIAAFNTAVAAYTESITPRYPAAMSKIDKEIFFNHLEPFYWAMVMYVFAFVLVVLGWVVWTKPMNKAALWMTVFVFAVHTAALIFRMYLQGRPPVTNLYSSAIFIGWGAVGVALLMERWNGGGLGTATAAVMGFLSLLVAHNLSGDGDTMEMMRAVLDTNFWLATHVTTVTLGYSGCFMAGFLAIVFVVRGVFTKSLTPDVRRQLNRMIYGVIGFSVFFSFVGTVLGGIWADQSWGRFWGWDPKENGALLIVIWCAIVLHARWGGLVKDRGVVALAIAGNMVTAWSWFGVNMLGVGLHSYGFTSGAMFGMLVFYAVQIFFLALTAIPERYWRSYQGPPTPPAPKTAIPA